MIATRRGRRAANLTGVVIVAALMGYALYEQHIVGLEVCPLCVLQRVAMITLGFVFLVVGCFLDAIPAIVIVGTVLQPLAASVDMNPVHFAIVSIVSLAFGLVTPPYGLCLMIACAVAGVDRKSTRLNSSHT